MTRLGVDAEIDLAALADHVERRTEADPDFLVLRRVVDLVLADELEAAVRGIELRNADTPGRQRHAEASSLVVLELEVDVDLAVHRQAELALGHRLAPAVVAGEPVVDQRLARRDLLRGIEQLDLLGRIVRQRRAPAERVEVELEERLLLEAGVRFHGPLGHRHRGAHHLRLRRLDALHVAGDQLELRIR
jgi:hypothetical protein